MERKRRIAIALDLETAVPHHHDVFAGTQRYALEHPQWECVIDEHPLHKQLSGIEPFRKYDGVIARVTSSLIGKLKRFAVPVVNTWFQTARPDLPGVYSDHIQAGQLAADHLLDRGFREFRIIGGSGEKGFNLIGKFFVQRVQENGCNCLVDECPRGSYGDPAYWAVLVKCLNNRLDRLTLPSALFVCAPLFARFLVNLCRNRHWRVPQDVAILCHIDVKLMVEHPAPQISSIDMNYERVGYEAAALLDRLMDGEPAPEEPILVPPKGVIARESTDYFAVKDEIVAEALSYIASHLRDRLSVDRIAWEIAASKRSLQRRFEATLGRPVSDEIRRLRLEKAKRLLGDPERQIKEIARMTGFGAAEYMTKVFRRELNITPTAYRKQVMGKKENLVEH